MVPCARTWMDRTRTRDGAARVGATIEQQRPVAMAGGEGRMSMTVGDLAAASTVGAVPSRAEFGSDYIVEILRALGIAYAAFNPGSSFRGIHDSLVNFPGEGGPEIIECLHEEISVAIAHG